MRSGVCPVAVAAFHLAVAPLCSINAAAQSQSGEPHIRLGNRFFLTGRYHEAVKAYEQALPEALPTEARLARAGIVTASLRAGDFKRARDESGALVTTAPNDPDALALYGDALWSSGLFDEAEARYREAITLAPDRAHGHHGMARALAGRNRLDEALAEAQLALALAPENAEAHQTLAIVYQRMRQYPAAAEALRAYLERLPRKDSGIFAAWSRSQVEFLDSFGQRVPYEVDRDESEQVFVVAFRLVDKKIVVQARVNGAWFQDFVVDTGAEQAVLSRWTARDLGVVPVVYTPTAGVGGDGIRELQLARIDSLEIGSLKLRNVPCLIKDSRSRGAPSGITERLSPIAMGLSMVIDYRTHQMIIGRHLQAETADLELPLRTHRLATVRGMVDGTHAGSFIVDTGGDGISISQATATALGRPEPVPKIRLRVFGASGWDPEAFLLPFVRLEFDAVRYPSYAVAVLNLHAPSVLLGFQIGGIIGYDFLSRYRVMFDLDRSALRLTKVSARAASRPS